MVSENIKIFNKILESDNWKLSKSIVYVHKTAWIPISKIEDDYVLIFFSKRLEKETLKLLKLLNNKTKFYLVSPLLSDPKINRKDIDSINLINIKNYLMNWADYYYSFRKINFDLVSNLVSYCNEFDCFEELKVAYDDVSSKILKETYDYYRNDTYYKYDEVIRDEFSGLYRQIRINQILN
jgi:hypothetical protein